MTVWLRSVNRWDDDFEPPGQYPFTLRVWEAFDQIDFPSSVTFFVGENGSGKSTLLEAIAASVPLPAIGTADLHKDESLEAARRLGDKLRFVWNRRNRRGFFLRAEDFFGFAKRTRAMQQEYTDMAEEFGRNLTGYGRQLAMGVAQGEKAALNRRYGDDLDAHSHGESFLELFRARFVPGGLYLLDEPEAPLSPGRQLALIAMINEMVAEGAQFIIATHSPILMAIPGATIWQFEAGAGEGPPGIRVAAYDELEHVTLTRTFLNDPQSFLRHL